MGTRFSGGEFIERDWGPVSDLRRPSKRTIAVSNHAKGQEFGRNRWQCGCPICTDAVGLYFGYQRPCTIEDFTRPCVRQVVAQQL